MTVPDFLTKDEFDHIRLTGHRISLEDIVYYYNEGYSAESLVGQFPTLSLALIHKVIAFYLENQAEVDKYAEAELAACERLRAEGPGAPSLVELRERLEKKRRAQAS
jgi:uncharacterized protein (DUF433 family)